LKGGGEEVYEPHFTFMGFRYVAIAGYPGELRPEALTGIVIHSDMTPTGAFETSNPLLNQLQRNVVWGLKGNFLQRLPVGTADDQQHRRDDPPQWLSGQVDAPPARHDRRDQRWPLRRGREPCRCSGARAQQHDPPRARHALSRWRPGSGPHEFRHPGPPGPSPATPSTCSTSSSAA
jgi:hypothetical protein